MATIEASDPLALLKLGFFFQIPDGVWTDHEANPGVVDLKGTVTNVVVCDVDGKNPKTVATAKATENTLTISGLDWR